MEQITAVLQKTHDTTASQPKDCHFFSLLGDYVKLVKENPEISSIIKPLQTEKERKSKEIELAEKEAVAELVNLKDILLKEIKKKKIVCDELKQALLMLKRYENGEVASIFYESTRLKMGIEGVLKVLPDSEAWSKKYNTHTEKYLVRGTLNDLFNDKKKTEMWGVWDKLDMLFIVLFEADSYLKRLDEGSVDMENFKGLLNEMKVMNDKRYEAKKLAVPLSTDFEDWQSLSSKHNNTIPLESDLNDWIEGDEGKVDEFNRSNYAFYLGKIHVYVLARITMNGQTEIKKTKIVTLYLNNSGELYREQKSKHCYEIGEKSDRHKIIRFLADGEYRQTEDIANELGGKNKHTLRTEIGKINGNVKKYLGCKTLLKGKKESGYRINPKYRILVKS